MKSSLLFWMEKTVSLEKAKNGANTLKRGNKYLHSIYNPQREAQQQLKRFNISSDSICLCIEPLLGYTLDVLEKELGPRGKILLVELDNECSRYRIDKGVAYPRCPSLNMLPQFLESFMNEINMDRFILISIAQSEKLYPDEHRKILEIWKSNLERLSQNRMNSRFLGPSRIRNSLKSLGHASSWCEMEQVEKGDVLLVAPGPSLENHLDLLKEYSERLCVFALSSAVSFLEYNKIPVDAVFTSDTGYWASFHYRHKTGKAPVIMPLSAHLSRKEMPSALIPFNENQYISQRVLPEESLFIPDFATVAASALFWLSRKVQGRIYIAGLDLSAKDIQSHARPYSFDSLIECSTNRLSPLQHQYYHRYYLQDPAKTKNSPLDIYRIWFMDHGDAFGDKLISITPSFLPIKHVTDKKQNAIGDISQWEIKKMEDVVQRTMNFIDSLETETKQIMENPPEEWNPSHPVEDFYYQLHPEYFLQKDVDMNSLVHLLPLWLDEIKEKLNVILG